MNKKKLIKSIIFILTLLLIVFLTEKLSNVCLIQAKINSSIKYNYLSLLSSLIGYTIIGFLLGFDDVLKEYRKKEKIKINYTIIIGLAIPSLIIGFLPLLHLIVYKSTIEIPYNIFFLVFGLQLSKSVVKDDL